MNYEVSYAFCILKLPQTLSNLLVLLMTFLLVKVKHCKLLYTHTMEEIRDILRTVEERLKTKNFFQVTRIIVISN